MIKRTKLGQGTFSFTTKFLENSRDTSIFCNLEISDYANLIFTIDTGAMTSIIRSGKIRRGTIVNRDHTQFRGLVKGHSVNSIGKVTTSLSINHTSIEHTFYIINDDINLTNDGILGLDFLKTYKARIDYYKNEIKLQFPIYAHISRKETKTTNTILEKWDDSPETVFLHEKKNSLDLKPQTITRKLSSTTDDDPNKKIKFNEVIEIFIYDSNEIEPSKKITTHRKKKNNNREFFQNLPDDYFSKENFPKIISKAIELDDEPIENQILNESIELSTQDGNFQQEANHTNNVFLFQDTEDENINDSNSVNSEENEIIDTTDRLKYLKDNVDLSHCRETKHI